jgi:hypothetical protein
MHSNVRCPSQRSTTLGLAVVLSLAGSVLAAPGAQAQDAAITECSTAGLISKITEANQAAGSVTITLAARCTYTLTAAAGTSANGPNGLPVITGDITLDGNNSVIRRAPDAPAFRILEVAETAKARCQRSAGHRWAYPRTPKHGTARPAAECSTRASSTCIEWC